MSEYKPVRRHSFNDLGEHPSVIEAERNRQRDEMFVFHNEHLFPRPEFTISPEQKLRLARMRN